MQLLEDKILEYTESLSEVTEFQEDYTLQLNVSDNNYIIATHELIENNQWVYKITLYSSTDEIIDSVYCDKNQDGLEDIVFYLIEEYM